MSQADNPRKALIAIHSVNILFAFTAQFSKLIELSAMAITAYRAVIAMLVLFVIYFFMKGAIRLEKKLDYFLVGISGILLCIHWVTYFHSMQLSTVAIGMISLFTFPVFTTLLEPFFEGKRPLAKDILISIIMLIGISLLVLDSLELQGYFAGILWGVFSAICFAMRNIIFRRYLRHYDPIYIAALQILIVCILLLPMVTSALPSALELWWVFLLLGAILTALPHTLVVYAIKYAPASKVSVISCLQPVYGAIVAAFILSEIPSVLTVVGMIVIFSCAYYESVRKH